MKQKNKNLTFQDVKALFETDLTDLCALALACKDAEAFRNKLADYLKSDAVIPDSPAVRNLEHLLAYDGKTVCELSTGEEVPVRTLTMWWEWLTAQPSAETPSLDFLLDVYHQFLRLYVPEPEKPTKEQVRKWMRRWPGGLDEEVKNIRRANKARIIDMLVKRIEHVHAANSRYSFAEGMTYEEKVDKVKEWWYDYRFQLAMAARSVREINKALDHTLPDELVRLYHEVRKKGIPVFVTPYYLSLLNPYDTGYDDASIRSYVLYSPELVETFGQIRAWEKEDIVEAGKPNAAGWLLPEGHSIHRRYPEVAILIVRFLPTHVRFPEQAAQLQFREAEAERDVGTQAAPPGEVFRGGFPTLRHPDNGWRCPDESEQDVTQHPERGAEDGPQQTGGQPEASRRTEVRGDEAGASG